MDCFVVLDKCLSVWRFIDNGYRNTYISINGMKRKSLETSKQFYSKYVNYCPIYTRN